MIFERVESKGLAHYSYVVGDEEEGVCVVIDPRRDVEVYLDIARRHRVQITHILETHIHADFVSGSCELAAQTGAVIGVGAEGRYGFDHRALVDGEVVEVGRFRLAGIHTPGHTPEHLCYLISGGRGAEAPWGLFTGDTLFAGEVGRPDLLGQENEAELARQLYHSLHERLFPLGDELSVYPAHGAGSPCGTSIGDRSESTLGYERRNNPLLRLWSAEEFARQLLAPLTPAPRYYPATKEVNARGPAVLGRVPRLRPLPARAFAEAMQQPDVVVVDAREIVAFGGGHIARSLNIALRQAFPIWVGRLLAPEQPILLVLPDEDRSEEAARHLWRIGYENVSGYLRRGLRGWTEAGCPFRPLPLMSVEALKRHLEAGDGLQLLDVRSRAEWEEGHIPGAQHLFVAELVDNLDRLNPQEPVAVYCGSGYRSSMAASLLLRHGFEQVINIPGSITAWKAAGYPLVEG